MELSQQLNGNAFETEHEANLILYIIETQELQKKKANFPVLPQTLEKIQCHSERKNFQLTEETVDSFGMFKNLLSKLQLSD